MDSQYHVNIRHDVLHLVDKNPGRVLDVGGGAGATAAYLKAEHGASYAAVADAVALPPIPEIDLYRIGDLEDEAMWASISEDAGPFDTILCLDVLEHLVDPWQAVRRCCDLLSPGGTLIVSVPNARYHKLTFPLFFKGRFTLQDSGILDRTHLRWFVRETAIDLVSQPGLDLESFEGGWYLNRARGIEKLAKAGIAPGFLFLNYFAKCRKVAAAG
ncbi:class I SAM-dependent methyltransferase [Meridianimarinicoccus roseus]|uniref:class I SAM-dependent methyltransferase n=1 Tax=Meridianimarinicoccus roseus TaxID=2072018 RepID=UPI001EE67946|nr:methyltransferase domain-containing protein [Meridianimarinicoccus roseus]